MSTKQVGKRGEDLACEYLVKKGYKILGRNWKIKFGEIDIICRKKWGLFVKNPICFIEVKALSKVSGPFSPEQRANWKKQQKVRRLAEIWLSKNKIPENTPYQIDVIAVSSLTNFEQKGNDKKIPRRDKGSKLVRDKEYEIKHFENVVSELDSTVF